MKRLTTFLGASRRMGLANTIAYIWTTKVVERVYRLIPHKDTYRVGTLRTRAAAHPLLFRYGSSDISVFSQIFILDEYGSAPRLSDVRLIVDCGGNVGYSAAYFLSKYPDAEMIVVEPDARNFELLTRNLAPYGRRVRTVHSAIWSHSVGLTVCRGSAASEWATVVRESAAGEVPDLRGTDIGSLLQQNDRPAIDILKMDIEGSESIVFSDNYDSWLPTIRLLIIELHNAACAEVFYRALAAQPFTFSESGELTVAMRRA